MSNAIVPFEEVRQISEAMVQSGYFQDAKNANQAIVKVMAGRELGIGAFASMSGIHIIQGKPALGANLLASLIKNDHRYDYRVIELTDERCEIVFIENGQEVGRSAFDTKDAKRVGTKNMDKFPKNMLFARAISNGAKWFTPGIFGGAPVYTPEELGADIDEEGNIIDVTPTVTRPTNNTERMEALGFENEPEAETAKPKKSNGGRTWDGAVITAIKKDYPDKEPVAIVKALNKSNLEDTRDVAAARTWYADYHTAHHGETPLDSDAAAAFANVVPF